MYISTISTLIMSRAGKQLAIISLFAIVLAVLQAAYSTPLASADFNVNQDSPIVYRRWVRRRPSEYPTDLYVDDVVEEFHVRRRPPQHILTDEEVDRIIRCDFEPSLKECEKLSKARAPTNETPKVPQYPQTTVPPQQTRPTYTPTRAWTPRSTRPTSTTTIMPEIITTTKTITTEIPTTTTEDLPFLPDIPNSEEETGKDPEYDTEVEENEFTNKNEMENTDTEIAGNIPEEEEEDDIYEEPDDEDEEADEDTNNDYDNNL